MSDDQQPKIKVNGKDIGQLPPPGTSLKERLDKDNVGRREVIAMLDRALAELRVCGEQHAQMGQLLTLLMLREGGGLVDSGGRLMRDEIEVVVDQRTAGAMANDRWDFSAEGKADGTVVIRARRVKDEPAAPTPDAAPTAPGGSA